MDTVYPEPMSLLRRRAVRKNKRGDRERYRTQPVTFSEIKEVDEDNIDESTVTGKPTRLELDINKKFDEFKRLHALRHRKGESPSTSPTEDQRDPLQAIKPGELPKKEQVSKSNMNLSVIKVSSPAKPTPRTSI